VSALEPAVLVLADGTVFRGRSIGAPGPSAGEVVFNTAMTGYQEILTDPSYCRQIVTLTDPHIGNTGVNAEDEEAARVHAAGLVVRDLPVRASSWRSQADLGSYLRKNGIVAIADIDTRKLTRLLREKGAQNGCVMAGEVDVGAALSRAKAFPGLAGMDNGPRAAGGSARASSRSTKAASMSWPTTTASSATSCACWSRGAPGLPSCPRRFRRRKR
jgi:carbamoyl-phosphate synthase small subunit